MEHLPEGSSAPDFELPTAGGSSFRLSRQTENGPVLLAFFKVSCPTCQLTLPVIEQLFDGFDEGARPTIWAVSQDDAGDTMEFVRRFGLSFPVLIDEHPFEVSSDYGLRYVPTLFVVDGDGRIRLADHGFSKPALTKIAGMFSEHLNQPAPMLFGDTDGLPDRRPG